MGLAREPATHCLVVQTAFIVIAKVIILVWVTNYLSCNPKLIPSLPLSTLPLFASTNALKTPAGDHEILADLKVEVSSVVIRQEYLNDVNTPLGKCSIPISEVTTPGKPEPILVWGTAIAPDSSAIGLEEKESESVHIAGVTLALDPRTVTEVRRCLIERARRLPLVSYDSEVGDIEAIAESAGTPQHRQREAYSEQCFSTQLPAQEVQTSSYSAPRTMPEECALQYRLLKRKGGALPIKDAGNREPALDSDAVSTVAWHDIALGSLRVQLVQSLLEKLVEFVGLDKCEGKTARTEHPGGEEKKVIDDAFRPPYRAAVSPTQEQGWSWRAGRSYPRVGGTSLERSRLPGSPASTATVETSLHFALNSVGVALDLAETHDSYTMIDNDVAQKSNSDDHSAFCVLSLNKVDITGFDSASVLVGVGREQQDWQEYTASSTRIEDETRERVCSLSLGDLSVLFIDEHALLATKKRDTAVESDSSPLVSKHSGLDVFVASTCTDLPDTHHLLQLGGARVNAEILSKPSEAAWSGRGVRAATGDNAARNMPDFIFKASCESVHVCTSLGAALLALEVCLLTKKTLKESPKAKIPRTGSQKLNRGWHRGVEASFEGVCVGGVVKNGGGQFTGDMRLFSVRRVSDRVIPLRVSPFQKVDVALFEPLHSESGGEALSWSLEVFYDVGCTSIKFGTNFKSGTLHFTNARKAVKELKILFGKLKAGAAATSLFGGLTTAEDAELVAGVSPRTAEGRRRVPIEFDIRGSAVTIYLPFDLHLEVEGVHLSMSPVDRVVPARNVGCTDGDLDIDIMASDVRISHALYGTRCSPDDARPPVIRCAARGVVAIRPGANATSVSLDSEYVRVRLTPAFCAAFGSFVRSMVGPPLRPSLTGPTALEIARSGYVPKCFTFELGLRKANVDFFTGPCNPWTVSSNLIVGGFFMRHKLVGAISPGTGSQASFRLSFETIKATQQRDPHRNAPAFPQKVVRLIGTFLQPFPGSSSALSGFDLFSAWLLARKEADGRDETIGTLYSQPFIITLDDCGDEDRENAVGQVFSVMTTSMGPRHRLVNSLSLKLAPILLACYPPTFRLLVGHYNRFGANAFRLFRSHADLPRKRIAVVSYDVDIRGCSAVLLASLATGARGIHVSAGIVTFKEVPAMASGPIVDDTVLAMSGFVGPAEMAFVQDWRSLLPSSKATSADGVTTQPAKAATTTKLCAPIDLRWAVFYDRHDRCRQDISLSSVQLYLEQPHFDLCVRVAQLFIAAEFSGALPPKSQSRPTAATKIAGNLSLVTTTIEGPGGSNNNTEIESFLAMSLRLPLVQLVLTVGKRNKHLPPVLEVDIASVRLAKGGILTVQHVSVNSWPQEFAGPTRPGAAPAQAADGGTDYFGYRVLRRSGQSEESGKDFVCMEVRVPESLGTRQTVSGPLNPQVDVVIQVRIASSANIPCMVF